MNTIVKAKSWKIFAVLLSGGFIHQFIDIKVFDNEINEVYSDISHTIYYLVILSWILVTGIYLNGNLKPDRRVGTNIPVTTGLFLLITIAAARFSWTINETFDFMQNNTWLMISYIVFSFVSLFIICGFTAKTIKLNETSNEINVNDYFGDIFKILIWPIGVWFIQPRINNIFRDNR